MTRINSAINVKNLTDEHLLAEHREITRVPSVLKKFTWKQTGKDSYGFIAQELEQHIPESILENNEGIKSVSYDVAYAKILASIIHKIKEIDCTVSLLSSKIL